MVSFNASIFISTSGILRSTIYLAEGRREAIRSNTYTTPFLLIKHSDRRPRDHKYANGMGKTCPPPSLPTKHRCTYELR